MIKTDNYFYKVPNQWIRGKPPDVKRICTYYLLNEVRGLSDKGMVTIKYIIENCGYKCRKGTDGINNVYKAILSDAITKQDIILNTGYTFPPRNLSDGIPYTVNSINFDEIDNFTKLTDTEFDLLIKSNHSKSKECLMGVYLYIKSYYHQGTVVNRPIGFYQSLTTVQNTIGYSPKFTIKVLNDLVDIGLLHKHIVGSRQFTRNGAEVRENVPNIYIPNLGQSQDEINETIKSTVALMKEFYNVDKFLPFMKNGKEN